MIKKKTIKINWESKSMYCRTIDPSDGFDIENNGSLTLYSFETYKSNKHNTSADVTVLENTGGILLLRVDSIDWISGQQYPYSTQGCFLIQQTIEKYNKVHLSVDRIPCSKKSINEAIEYLTPAEVKNAEKSGRIVKRQGDFFFVQMKRKSNFSALEGTRHTVSNLAKGLKVHHPEHKILNLGKGKHWKAVQRKTMNHIKAD